MGRSAPRAAIRGRRAAGRCWRWAPSQDLLRWIHLGKERKKKGWLCSRLYPQVCFPMSSAGVSWQSSSRVSSVALACTQRRGPAPSKNQSWARGWEAKDESEVALCVQGLPPSWCHGHGILATDGGCVLPAVPAAGPAPPWGGSGRANRAREARRERSRRVSGGNVTAAPPEG